MKETTRQRKQRALVRLKGIYYFIEKEERVTTQALADEFGWSVRTIRKDLATLASNKLVYSPSPGVWKATGRKVVG